MADGSEGTSHFGAAQVPIGEKQQLVDAVFQRVARRYDLMNDLMSAGVHRLWKDAMVSRLSLPKGVNAVHVLDLAGGTGDIAFRVLRRGGPGTRVSVVDINPEMLKVGRERAEARHLSGSVEFIEGNAESLPLPDRSFDAATIAFGIRNVPRIEQALSEVRRVLKPGGHFLCLEFSRVDVPVLDRVYDAFSFSVIPRLGALVAGDADSYRYLVESIRRFPDSATFAGMMRKAGFQQVSATPLSGGIAAIHSGWRL
jgi:demethylmenaquinone methyltransferase / 2-methoxy-6-polyprenyl-1,4-benzoquinol methylase